MIRCSRSKSFRRSKRLAKGSVLGSVLEDSSGHALSVLVQDLLALLRLLHGVVESLPALCSVPTVARKSCSFVFASWAVRRVLCGTSELFQDPVRDTQLPDVRVLISRLGLRKVNS